MYIAIDGSQVDNLQVSILNSRREWQKRVFGNLNFREKSVEKSVRYWQTWETREDDRSAVDSRNPEKLHGGPLAIWLSRSSIFALSWSKNSIWLLQYAVLPVQSQRPEFALAGYACCQPNSKTHWPTVNPNVVFTTRASESPINWVYRQIVNNGFGAASMLLSYPRTTILLFGSSDYHAYKASTTSLLADSKWVCQWTSWSQNL